MSYIVLLLRAWKKPAARNVMEAAIVLMLNDRARRQILGRSGTSIHGRQRRQVPEFVRGLDGLLGDLRITGLVTITNVRGRQVIRLGTSAPSTATTPASDIERCQETLKALEVVGEDQVLVELEEIVDEQYDLVP